LAALDADVETELGLDAWALEYVAGILRLT
jgi:hypothetical protein